jgi:aryl-alcohol dehydrogenase-like predicted oxidoreductase
MAQPGLTAPIASATSAEQVEELLKATDLQLDVEALEQLEGASIAA